ncbi:hypothetical protein GCM10029992_09260 [Glycomyces albus]
MRTLGPTLVEISEQQETLEGDLVSTFQDHESEIEDNGYSSEASDSFDSPPAQAPAPDDADENPYADQLDAGPNQPI